MRERPTVVAYATRDGDRWVHRWRVTVLHIVGGLAVAPVALYVAFVLAGPGHGAPSPALCFLFPWLVLTIIADISGLEGHASAILVAAIQFPLYGACYCLATSKRNLRVIWAVIASAHLVAAIACIVLFFLWG